MEITIKPAPVTAANPSDGTQGQPYSFQISASGGTAPYTYAATGLPAGLTCSVDGLISGTPTVAGTFTFELDVTDASGAVTKL